MAGIQGYIGRVVENAVILPDNQRLKVQFDQEISYLNVDKNLLMHFSSKLKKNAVERMKFSWNTQERKKLRSAEGKGERGFSLPSYNRFYFLRIL